MEGFEKCYTEFLSLEKTDSSTYLDYTIGKGADGLLTTQHFNKNLKSLLQDNKQHFYTHQHFGSYGPAHVKRGALIGTWTRIHNNCSNEMLMKDSISQKLSELKVLGYTQKQMLKTLTHMTKKTKSAVWLDAFQDQSSATRT